MNSEFAFQRVLNQSNIDKVLYDYFSSIENIGATQPELMGIEFFLNLKRGKVGTGPYPEVSMFEAANRIMTDIVILRGIKWLIKSSRTPFTEFRVEYGNEDKHSHDITAENCGIRMAAEAFNVAPSFFQTKKRLSTKKLANSEFNPDYKLVIANSDSVSETYSPKLDDGFQYLFVDVNSDSAVIFPKL